MILLLFDFEKKSVKRFEDRKRTHHFNVASGMEKLLQSIDILREDPMKLVVPDEPTVA